MVIGKGYTDRFLTEEEARGIIVQGLSELTLSDKRVLVIIPDSTRSGPMPMMFRLLTEQLLPRVRTLDYLVALGTHRAMTEEQLCDLVGITAEERETRYAKVASTTTISSTKSSTSAPSLRRASRICPTG